MANPRRRRAAVWSTGAVAVLALIGQCGANTPKDTTQTASTPAPATPTPSAHPPVPTATPTPTHSATPTPSSAVPTSRPNGSALATLDVIPVKGRSAMTGYDRDRFGYAWLDADRNGCDTRNDVLRRDLTGVVLKPNTGGCVVLSGTLADPYLREQVRFVRGGTDEVDIDHVVPLADAWVTGAATWDIHRRAALANDPLNLLAVDYRSNRQKGSGDAATWLPGNRSFWCPYVARQIAVKHKYGLWVTPPERDAMRRVLGVCRGQSVTPDSWHLPIVVTNRIVDPGPPAPER